MIFTDLGEAVHAGAMVDRKQQQDTGRGARIGKSYGNGETLKMGPVLYTFEIIVIRKSVRSV